MPTGLASPFQTLVGSPRLTSVFLPIESITSVPSCHTDYFEYSISGDFSVADVNHDLPVSFDGSDLKLYFSIDMLDTQPEETQTFTVTVDVPDQPEDSASFTIDIEVSCAGDRPRPVYADYYNGHDHYLSDVSNSFQWGSTDYGYPHDCALRWPGAVVDKFEIRCNNHIQVTELYWTDQDPAVYDPDSAELCDRVQVDYTQQTFTFKSEDFMDYNTDGEKVLDFYIFAGDARYGIYNNAARRIRVNIWPDCTPVWDTANLAQIEY